MSKSNFILSFAPKHLQEIQNKVLSEVPKSQQHDYFIAYTLEHVFGKDWKYIIQTTNFLVGRNEEIQIDGEQFDNYEKYFQEYARYFLQGAIIERCKTIIIRTIIYAYIYLPVIPTPPHTWTCMNDVERIIYSQYRLGTCISKKDQKILKLGCSGMSKGIKDTTIATILKYVDAKDREEYMVLESWIKYILRQRKMEMTYKIFFSENIISKIRNHVIEKDLLRYYSTRILESIANSDTFNYIHFL